MLRYIGGVSHFAAKANTSSGSIFRNLPHCPLNRALALCFNIAEYWALLMEHPIPAFQVDKRDSM